MSPRGTQLHRLTRILQERGAPVRPVLRAVEAAHEPGLYMEVSALSRRMTLLLPYRAEILEELAPGVSAGPLPSRPMLKLFIDGDQLHVALAAVGEVPPNDAVDMAPASMRAAWVDAVSSLVGTGLGQEGLEVACDDGVEQGAPWLAAPVARRAGVGYGGRRSAAHARDDSERRTELGTAVIRGLPAVSAGRQVAIARRTPAFATRHSPARAAPRPASRACR